jgi:hypothetical protein
MNLSEAGIAVRIFALLIAVGMLLWAGSIIGSEDWYKRIEGLLLAPALIAGAVAIIIEVVRKS